MVNARQKSIQLLTREEIISILGSFSRRYPTPVRNAALVAVLYRAGLRVSEALQLRETDLDEGQGTLLVRKGKRGKSRTVPMDGTAWGYVARWRERRRALQGVTRSSPVFCTLEGGPVADSYVRHLLRRVGEKLGLEKPLHPHLFRHCYAAELAREGVPLNQVQKLLGHGSLATTSVYLDSIAPAELIATVANRPAWEI
jgi:site-specific recombinase XerD